MRWPILRVLLVTSAVMTGTVVALDDATEETGIATPDHMEAGEGIPGTAGQPEPLPGTGPILPATEPESIPHAIPEFTGALFGADLPIEPGPIPDGLANLSAQSCNACHFEVHEQWEDGAHSRSASNPRFDAAMVSVGDSTACRSCHLPLQAQHARLAEGYHEGDPSRPVMTDNPSWDPTLTTEGVTCVACHVRDGHVLSTRVVENAPHPMATSDELGSSVLCASCHQLGWDDADTPIYDTYGEWSRSAYAEAGVRCQDCHMPPTAGLSTATRFAAMATHSLEADMARALSVLVEVDSENIVRGTPWALTIRLQNTGAGHAVPTGSPFKRMRLSATLFDERERELDDPIVFEFGREISDSPPWETLSDNRIMPGEEMRVEGEWNVSQRKRAGQAILVITLEKLVDDEVIETTTLQQIPLNLQ